GLKLGLSLIFLAATTNTRTSIGLGITLTVLTGMTPAKKKRSLNSKAKEKHGIGKSALKKAITTT
ncbi:alpha amylase, catalytic domain protein, partial [Vibrio parahaemolyticus V-223/04]